MLRGHLSRINEVRPSGGRHSRPRHVFGAAMVTRQRATRVPRNFLPLEAWNLFGAWSLDFVPCRGKRRPRRVWVPTPTPGLPKLRRQRPIPLCPSLASPSLDSRFLILPIPESPSPHGSGNAFCKKSAPHRLFIRLDAAKMADRQKILNRTQSFLRLGENEGRIFLLRERAVALAD